MTGTMVSHQANNDGLPQYHLRRIGRRPSRPDVSNFIDFKKRITLIGRNREVVDYVLNTANEVQNRSISRIHARVIRALPSNRHRLVDSSFTGVYINDRRQDGDVILREGDTVTFGHPQSSCLDQGKRIRQPNSEFHFLFELCDCKIGQGTEQGQELRLCTTPLTPLVLSAAFPRFSTPALLLGTASGLMPGQLSSTGDTGGKTALHDLGKPTAVTEVQNHPPLANGVQWLPFAHCSPEWMELASQGNDSTDPDAPLPVTLAQPSLMPISVIGVNPITSGSIVGVHLHSQTQGRGPFPPELLAVWNERLNEPTASGDGESSRRQLANSDERLSSREAGQLLSEGLETRASPSGQGGGAGANHHFTSLSMSRCHRDGSKHEGEASLPADASTLQEGICTSPLSCPNIVQDAQDETQGKIQGTTMNIANSGGEPVMGTERAFATKKALPNDTGAVDAALPDDTKVSKATEAAGPRLDLDTTGQFNLCQGEDTLTEFTVQDTQDLENSGSSIREACRDSVSSNCQMRENELHVQNEDCHLQLSRGGDLVMGSISFYKAAQGQDCPTWSIVENTSATVTLAPLGKRQHDAMGNSPENTHAQHYSASNKSPRTQTPECSGNLSKKLQVIYQGRDVPGQDLPLKGRLATTYIGNKESERFPGDPQRLLADPAWAEEELPLSTVAVNPITVDAEFTALNGESIGASLDGDHLDEAQATAGGDYIRPAGRSVCENGEQQLPDHSHSCTIVGDKQETISILALWTQAHNSFPEAVSSLLTKQMGKDGNLIHSETTEGLGFLVESQVSHKQKVLSVGCSQDRKPMEDGKSSVQLPPTVSDTLWAKFSTLDNSVPKADSSTCVAEAKPEPKVAVEMTGHNNSFPVNTFSMSGSSNTGAKNGNDQWVMPNMKLCSSPVGSGLVDREGAQEHISTAGQPMEGHCVCVTNQRGLETGLSGMEMGVSEMEMGVSGMETGVSEMEMGLSGMETGVSEMEMGLSGMETGVSGELSMGVSGELQMDVSEMVTDVSGMETGVSIMESSVSRELEMGVSGDPQMGVSELGMGVSGDPETGVSEMVIDVSGMKTGVSGELETGASGELETGASGELETGASGELETGTSGELETGASGELQTGVSGDPQMGVSELEMGVSGEPETGVSGEPVTGLSEMVTDVTGMETGVSIMESSVSRELEMSVSGMDTGASGELEMGVSWVPDLCEQSDGLRCDSGLPPLEQIMCQTSMIPILGRMEKVCDIGIGVEQCGPHVAEGDSDIKDASAMLYLSPKADAEELGDPAKMDKNVEVDLVPECVSGKMDVINLHPKGVARNVPSPEVEVTTSSTILERDVINEPKLLATSVAVSADMELQHEVSPYRRVDAHSELEQTESLAMPPWLSECVEPKPHRGEDGGVWPGSSALTVTFHSSGMQVGEAVDLLMPAGDPVAALVKLDAAAAPVSVAGVPPSCVSLPTSATASSPTQTERPSQAWTERAGEQRHREHLALKRLTCSVPSSVTVGLGDDSSLRFLMGPPGSENVVCLGEDSGLSLTEEPPMGQNAEGHSPAMPEDGEGVSTFESERAEESYLVCQNLTTRTVPGTTVLGGHREDFTVTGKTDLSSNSCVMETSKCEATEGGNQELCLVQWMHPAALGMSETERFSLPSALLNNGCGQVKEAKIAGSPLTPLGNVPTGWLTAAATPMSLGLPVPEGGTETTAPKGPVSEGGTDSTGSLGPLVPVEGTDTSMSLGLSIPEGGADITIPQGPVPEEETEIPMLLDLTVTEGGAENTGPLGPVPERGTNITAPQGPIVPEGGTDIIAPGLRTDLTAPQGQSVSEGETNITAPQGPFDPEGETVITAPQGHTVPGGETDITASWGHSVPEGGTDFTAPQVQSVPEGETVITAPQGQSVSEGETDITAPQGQTVPAGETDIIAPGHRTVITAQWGLSIPEGGPDITAPQGHTVPEGGTDFIAPQGHSVPEGETDITASWGHSVPEGGTDFTAPQGQSVSDGETVITASQDQSVSEGEMDITGPQDHSVSEGETDITAPGLQTDITAPQGQSVPEGGTDITAPQGQSVPEGGTDITAPQGHSVPEGETDLPAPQGYTVPEGETDLPASQGYTVPEGETDLPAPQGYTVPEGETDLPASQGYTVPEGETDLPAPQGYTVPEGETDLPAPQGYTVPEGETDLPASQGYTVPEGETDLPAPQGYTVPEGETDLPAPQGYTVPEGETELPAPQGYTVPEGETDLPASQGYTVPEGAALLQGPVDIREKGFGKEVLVAACNGGGSGFQQNQGLLGAAVLAVPTMAEQKVTVDASCPNTERNDDIAPDEWLLSSEKQLLTDATLMGELCGEEGDQPALTKDSACLIAGYRKQMKQRPTSAEEANRGAVNKSPVSQSSQFPSGCIKVLTSAELVGDQPPNWKRAELQEEADQTTSWGAEKDEGRRGESVPVLSDAAVRHLEYHSLLQGGDQLEALSASGPGQVDASPRKERAEGQQSGSGRGSKQRSVGSNELSARVHPSDLSVAGCVLETELSCSCPGDPNTQEERVDHSSFAITVQEAGDARSICKTCGAGEKPRGSEDQEPVGERHETSKESPAPEWNSRPSPVQALQMPRVWTAGIQEEPPRASPVSDNQQLHTKACSKAVLPLALIKPHALEDERLDGQKGLDERTNLVSNTIFSVGLRSPYEMGQEVDKDSTERDDSANFSEAWSMGWILGNQVPDNSKNEATRLEQGDGLSMRADGFGPSTESNLPVSYNQTVTEMAISSITNPATGAGVNLCQTLAAVGANGQNLATKELLLDPCPQTRCSKVTSVPVGESAEDLQLEDWRPEENCNSCLPGLPRDSDLLERPRFSKQAEVDPQCIAEEFNARELSGSKEFGIKSELDRGATKGTLGKNEVCATSHSPTYILKESIGTIETPIHCSHLSNNPRGTDKNLQQQSIVEIQNEDLLEKCRSPNAVGQPRTERVEVCAFEQDSQQGKVIQPSEGKESSLPEVPLAEVSWGKPMAVSVDSDVELERVEVSHQDLSRNKVENYNKVNLGLGADSTNIQLSLECLNAQPSESESEEENGAGSWRSDALSHSGIRTLKRPRLSEVADSNFRTTKPSKRSRTCRQTRAVGLRAAEGIKLSLQSFSKQLRQVQANYIGRLVQQFFTEYTQPWKRWVPKLVVVNRKDEVEIIVKKFFEALSIQSKAKAVDKSQQRVKPIASQQSMGLISELGQESREGDESSHQKQDAQLESPGLIGQGLARTHGPGGASFSKTAGPSSETSWRDLVDSDSETCPLQEGSGVAKESDTMQERSWHTKSEILSSSTHLDQISSAIAPGDVQEPAVEDFGLSFWLTHDEKVSAEKAEAFCAREMGPLLLPQCPSIVESLEQPGDDTYGESQRLGQKDTSCDGGTEEMACGGREPLSLEMPNSPLNPCGSARVECVEGGRTDERSSSSPAHLLADLVVDADVAGVLHDGRSSSDSSALILDIQPPDLAEASRIQEDLCHPGHNQDQCYKVMNVQPTALGCRKLLQCDSMDGLNVAQMACTDNKIKPDNTSFNSRSNNKVEVINVLEPSVLHHKIVGQNDGKIGLKIAESSALRSDGDNGVEPENEELLDHNNLSYSSTELECAKHLALTYDDLDYKDKGMNSVNIAEPSALAHDTPTSLTGRESASPLGQSTELQRSPSRLLDAETALQVAHSDRVELGQNLGGRRFLELPGPPRPDQRRDFGGKAGMVGCRSSGRSAREHQSGMAESFHLPANQLSGLEVKNHEGPGSQSAMAKNPTCSERWKSVGSFKSMEKPYLEMSRAAGAHRSRFNIDRRAHGEVFPESQVAAETAGESLPASSVPFAEDVKTEKGCGLADGVDCSSPDPFLPMGMPRARDCPEMLVKHRDMSPVLTDPQGALRPAMSEQPTHQMVEAGTVEGLQRSLLPKHQGEKSMETCKPWAPSARFLLQSPEHHWASSDQVIRSQLRECHFLLQDISEALQAKGVAEEHVADWKEQIKELEKQTVPPPTYIAVVGDTGSGKSSLLNALLDEEGILPTSAMRACTAVVVEVSLNTKSDHYRADVEFFSEEEWNKELLSLLSDMTDKYGRLRRRRPDPGSEASMAYSRVKAVYGKILLYQELKQLQEVTQYLGTTTTICEMQASEFRSKVQCFIDTRINDFSSSRGGEFWPIVKRVRIQVPKSSVLQTGAVLVDLPGVRDSNDARNSVAKEYLKTCDAVWIVANVTRAVDDKTAKETLDESLRRQLLMDGQFGCIAFICTKTDSHNVTEIMSALSLSDECNPLEEQIAKLRNEIEQRQVDHKNWTSDLEKARRSNQNGERAKQLEMAIKQLEVNLTKLHSEVSMNQSKLSLNSIKARNFFCKQKIYLNFKRGLQDLKNQARAEDTDSDEEQDETDDDGVEDDEVHPSMADPCLESHLPVFTVSSTEYLKLRDKLQRDGPPRVFHNIEDTEIPAVQKFVHQITLARKALGTEVVIRQLATFVSHIVNYLTNRRAQNANYQAKIQEALQDCLSCVRELFQQAAEDCSRDIENSFTTIRMHLNTGKKKAMRICESTVLRWGSRLPIGYPYPTYKATCSRNGIFSSSACGSIDFNEELSHPLLTSVQVIWNEVFSVSIPQHLTRFKADVLGKLEYFFNDLMQRLKWIEGDTQPVNYILLQQLNAVRAKLENFALKLLDVISARQRSISRILTPAVQSGMMPAYLKCASESGPGCFVQMKSCMEQHMHFQKEQLFTTACRKLGDQLDLLKQEIHSRLKLFLDEICNELLVQFEPLLKPLKIIDEIIPKLVNICRTTTAVCQRSHIDFTLPKFEEDNEEPGPAKLLRKPLGSGTPPLQELKKFLGRVKIMKINNVEVTPTAPVEILMDKLLLKYKVPDTQTPCEQPVPFQCLSACEFCPSIPFLILTYKKKYKSKERTDVVLLDEDQAMFGQWMEAVAERWQGQLEFRCLEVVQAVERLHFLHVIYQGSETKDPNEEEEVSCVWPRSNEDSSSSSCVFVGNFPPSRKRQWGEMDPPGVLSVPQGPSSWGQRSWINEEIQTQPPQLKKEKRDWQASRHSQDCEYRLKLPVLKKEFCDSAEEDFDSL
ncbi:uncharacterized protein [Narcine bancroftii]|uniref:uncharacterized protein isoform X2 n=1 Tax=Narcine bancroftii TaxID=1343680 RepID=UPI0038317002